MQLRDQMGSQGLKKTERNDNANLQRMAEVLADAQRVWDEGQKKVQEERERFADMMADFQQQTAKVLQSHRNLLLQTQDGTSQPMRQHGASAVPSALRVVAGAVKSTMLALVPKSQAPSVPPASASVHPALVAAQPSEQASATADSDASKSAAPLQTLGPDIAQAARLQLSQPPADVASVRSAEAKEQPEHLASVRSADTEQLCIAKPCEQPARSMAEPPAARPCDVKPDTPAEALGSAGLPGRAAFEAAQANFQKAQAQIERARLFLPLKSLLAQMLWREMKRRIVLLPDSVLATVVESRENFLAWISWVAEPAQFLRGM